MNSNSSSNNHSKSWIEHVFHVKYDVKNHYEENEECDVTGKRPVRRNPPGIRIVFLLFLFGLIAGLVNGTIQLTAAVLSKCISTLLVDNRYVPVFFFVAIALSVFSAGICKYFCRQATGSGLPEVRYILSSEMRVSEWQGLISLRVLITKIM